MRASASLIDRNVDPQLALHDVISPVTGEVIDRVAICSKAGVREAILRLSEPVPPPDTNEVFAFLARLRDRLTEHQDILFERTLFETGFIARDAREIVSGAIEFLLDFEVYVREQTPSDRVIRHSYSSRSDRDMRITSRPYRCVAALVPQNASLSLAITVIASALYAGARVLLRPSLQCASTGALLADLVSRSEPPAARIEIVNSLASDFVDVCCASPEVDVIHYIGSNQHALSVFNSAFSAGKLCLVDGQGNGIVHVDESFPVAEAARLITIGATRFNGETCTSINGVLVHQGIWEPLKAALIDSFRELAVGNPMSAEIHVGPLFSEKQAANVRAALRETSSGRLVCGGDVRGAYFTPAILEGVRFGSEIAREGFFGPAIWLQPVRSNEVTDWIRDNRFPLSDTILSTRREVIREFARASRAARVCVNEDPSIESMFEPWGGYPPSGLNPVSVWTEKYSQTYQLDGRLKEILAVPSRERGGGVIF